MQTLGADAIWGKPGKRKQPPHDPEVGFSVLETALQAGKQHSLTMKS